MTALKISSIVAVATLRASWQAGHDATLAVLRRMVARAGAGVPYGAAALGAGTFAAACYDDSGIADLSIGSIEAADTRDMEAWALSPSEWAEQIGSAFAAKAWDRAADLSENLVLTRSDAGDGGWSLHAPGTTDEQIAEGDVAPLLTGDTATGPTDADRVEAALRLGRGRA